MDKDINQYPLVTVTICTYNRGIYILKALESIFEQTYKNIEIVIVDDASTDNTSDIISNLKNTKFPITYILNKKNLGIALSRNASIRNAKGKYIAILDSDDYWIDKKKVQIQVDFLESHSDHKLIGTMATIVDEHGFVKGLLTPKKTYKDIRDGILFENQFIHSSVMYVKDEIIQKKYFHTLYTLFEDYDLILRIGRTGRFANIERNTTAYRRHSNNSTRKISFFCKILLFWIICRNIIFYPRGITGLIRRLRQALLNIK